MNLKGAYYDDFATCRIRDMAKIKASKMLMVKTKCEIALVRPGAIPDMNSSQFERSEINLYLLDTYLVQKIKGNWQKDS